MSFKIMNFTLLFKLMAVRPFEWQSVVETTWERLALAI